MKFLQKNFRNNIIIGFLVITVGQQCNLKCRDCGNFSPFAPKDMLRYQIDDIKKSIYNLLKHVDCINKIQIQGGEPFICEYIPELLDFLRANSKVNTITITTNGTMLPSNVLIDSIIKNNIHITVSNYGLKYQKELGKLFSEKGVPFVEYSFASANDSWYSLGGIDFNKIEDEALVQQSYISCPYRTCLTLEKNILGHCSRSTVAYRVQDFKPDKNDYYDLWDNKHSGKRFLRYLDRIGKSHMECCHFCKSKNGELIKPAIQINKIDR